MPKVSLKESEYLIDEKLITPSFRRLYQTEWVKVALAQKIVEMREENHLNQKQLADRLGVSHRFILQIENTEGRSLTLNTLVRIAEAMGHQVRISFTKRLRHDAYFEVA